jgi:F-type H+-transporting ATPase subunit c
MTEAALQVLTELLQQEPGVTDAGLRLIAAALAVGLGAIGPGVGIGIIFNGALQAMGRNPEAEATLRTNMILGFALTESIFIFGLVISLLIAFGIV